MSNADRYPSILQVMEFFNFEHLPPHLQDISREMAETAQNILDMIPEDDPELTVGLRKLLEAKDCFVRAKVRTSRA